MAHPRTRRDRTAVLWCLAIVVGAQFALTWSIETWRPSWGDPEYGYRLARLKTLVAEHPDRKLVVALGSSRTGNGFASDLPLQGSAGQPAPLVFNMSATGGAGPSSQLIMLRRLLSHGIKPDEVIFEAFFPYLGFEGVRFRSTQQTAMARVRLPDLVVHQNFAPTVAKQQYFQWMTLNALPWYSFRFPIVARHFPQMLPKNQQVETVRWRRILTPAGWIPNKHRPSPEMFAARFAIARRTHEKCQTSQLLDPTTDALWHELLDTCRREGIRVLSINAMPESDDYRKLYSPEKRAFTESYFAQLCSKHGVRFVDASSWVPQDQFIDGSHLLDNGAQAFTTRYWNEVYLKDAESRFAQKDSGPTLRR